jgi:chemotaxis protein methyltransferase CheR
MAGNSVIKDEVYKFFADYIFQNSGMVYAPQDYYRLESRINDLIRILAVESADDVYQMYKKNITPDMKAILINISTNNETYFFRDVKPFSLLAKTILPEFFSKVTFGPLKIWSAASSTGQEAFSMLMSAQGVFSDSSYTRINISASDISSAALKKAKVGKYSNLDIQRGLPITMLMKHFTQVDEGSWQINKNILSQVKFFEFNLLKDKFPSDAYHIIFCRNVLIYQDLKNKNAILNNIYDSLLPGGYLFLGNGESLIGVDTKFERLTIDGYTVFKKN